MPEIYRHSPRVQVFGSAGTLTLPDAREIVKDGSPYYVFAKSGDVVVEDNTNTTIATVTSGNMREFWLLTGTTQAGTWFSQQKASTATAAYDSSTRPDGNVAALWTPDDAVTPSCDSLFTAPGALGEGNLGFTGRGYSCNLATFRTEHYWRVDPVELTPTGTPNEWDGEATLWRLTTTPTTGTCPPMQSQLTSTVDTLTVRWTGSIWTWTLDTVTDPGPSLADSGAANYFSSLLSPASSTTEDSFGNTPGEYSHSLSGITSTGTEESFFDQLDGTSSEDFYLHISTTQQVSLP